MDSLEDILKRALDHSAEKLSQSGMVSLSSPRSRRPLRDPEANPAGFFQDVSDAVQSIRSPAVTQAMASQATVSMAEQGNADAMNPVPDGSSSSAESRKTTFRDDAQVMSQLASATVSVARQVTVAGRAIGEFTGSAGRFNSAVNESAEVTRKTARRPLAGLFDWNSYPRKDGFGHASAEKTEEKPETAFSRWLNSSSLADGVRNLVGSLGARIGVMGRANGGGSPGSAAGGQVTGSAELQDQNAGFMHRMNAAIDGMMARSMNLFRSMSSGSVSPAQQSLRSRIGNRIGRTGRYILGKHFRGRVSRGMARMASSSSAGGNVARAAGIGGGGGGGFAAGWPQGVASWASGGSGGGAAAAARAGGGGIGGGGAGAAAGGAAGGGAAAAGGISMAALAAGFLALLAVVVVVGRALYNLGMQGYQTSLRIAEWDGALTAAKTQLDISRLLRDIQTAHTLSDSGSRLMGSIDKLEAAFRPITDGAMVVGMEALIFMIDQLVMAFRVLMKVTLMQAKLMDFMLFDAIPDALMKNLEKVANGDAEDDVPQIAQAGFHDEFRNRPVPQPRLPLPPIGGP